MFSSWRTFVTGETVTAAHLNQEIRDNGEALFPDEDGAPSWTPTLEGTTNYDVTGQTGRQYRVGAMQFAWARFVFPGSGEQNGTGAMFVTLPNSSSGIESSTSSFSGQVIGSMHIKDASTSANNHGGTVGLFASDQAVFFTADGATVTGASPFTFDTGDILTIYLAYPIA